MNSLNNEPESSDGVSLQKNQSKDTYTLNPEVESLFTQPHVEMTY
jgi:hypothetical protein